VSSLTIRNHLDPEAIRSALVADARRGLTATPKDLPPKWFYDERGSMLFDEITRLDEYYPTRTERSILERHGDDIVQVSGADTLVELGSGTSEKTRLLLDAFRRAGRLNAFVPFDVSTEILETSAAEIAAEYPGTAVHAVAGDFEQHLGHIPRDGHRIVAFLGGTIGNFAPEPRHRFLRDLAATLDAGESLLLGTDLVKDPRRLVRAYDDASGVTAAFNRNVLRVLNRELGADFDPADFDHIACWNAENEWIEMWLRARRALRVTVPGLDLRVDFAADEAMRTEISAKFRRERVAENLEAAGFALEHWWTDAAGDFALSLGRRI
jgi:L-histidine Nalpha-methyltransferase